MRRATDSGNHFAVCRQTVQTPELPLDPQKCDLEKQILPCRWVVADLQKVIALIAYEDLFGSHCGMTEETSPNCKT
jgi:hypothetical protein